MSQRNKIMIIMLLALVVMIAFPVQGQTITMSNPGGIAERDIMVYYPNGTMQGFYNSTSVITLDETSDYIFTMKPISSNLLEDPTTWMTNSAFPFIQSNIIGLMVAFMLIGLLYAGRR